MGTPAAERKRQQRERDRQGDLFYQREDWSLFLDQQTLPQKAGCFPQDLRKIILKEVVDNALDAGATVTINRNDKFWIISDDGPGIHPDDIPRVFCVNRPLLSTKLKRLPLRGMLGNGLRVVMGATAAFPGASIIVETRGHRMELAVDTSTGYTIVTSDEPIAEDPGLTIRLSLGGDVNEGDGILARNSIVYAKCGTTYNGPSSPWWYGARDLERIFQSVVPATCTVESVIGDLGLEYPDSRIARSLSRTDIAAILTELGSKYKQINPLALGAIGRSLAGYSGYAVATGITTIQSGAQIPYSVEAWAKCKKSQTKGSGEATFRLVLNRSQTTVPIAGYTDPVCGIHISGCGIERWVRGPKTGLYDILLSVIAPYIQLATDGKEPDLTMFSSGIEEVIRKACGQAHREMERPERGITIKEAAWRLMSAAYQKASGNGKYPANARQIMYAARPEILRLTGKTNFDDAYFTQTLLPDYIEEHPEHTGTWDVVFDARGHFTEPHTGREIALGTLEVRQYLGYRPTFGSAVNINSNSLFPTLGPENRYSTVLFVEKEGFDPLLKSARISERYDIAIMSTKGMSVTAARLLLDRLSVRGVKRILVLHDFDRSGFSIFGTLGTDGRRYTFENELNVIDIGLRLTDVEELGLEAEPIDAGKTGEMAKRMETLERHGATEEEIEFLQTQRVELNAMTAPEFISFLEGKLEEHQVVKLVPDEAIIEKHARRIVEQIGTEKALEEILVEVQEEAQTVPLPEDLTQRIEELLQDDPELPWDEAVAKVIREWYSEGSTG
jgi:hypothetical protein